jgi:hypothetical protein
VRLVETGRDARSQGLDVLAINCPDDLGDIGQASLTLAEGKKLAIVAGQASVDAEWRLAFNVVAATVGFYRPACNSFAR